MSGPNLCGVPENIPLDGQRFHEGTLHKYGHNIRGRIQAISRGEIFTIF